MRGLWLMNGWVVGLDLVKYMGDVRVVGGGCCSFGENLASRKY